MRLSDTVSLKYKNAKYITDQQQQPTQKSDHIGSIHKRCRQFGGGRGGQVDDMGHYEGGRCQRKSDIVNSRVAKGG